MDRSDSRTYKFKSTIVGGPSIYVQALTDEYGIPEGFFVNIGKSGSTLHGVSNALGRLVSHAIRYERSCIPELIETLEGFGSESVWMNDSLGRAESIPAAIALVLAHLNTEAEDYAAIEVQLNQEPWAAMPDEENANCEGASL